MRLWHEIEIWNEITKRWELVLKVKSERLTWKSIEMLSKIYGNEGVRVVK
jgi:hypothetical protein